MLEEILRVGQREMLFAGLAVDHAGVDLGLPPPEVDRVRHGRMDGGLAIAAEFRPVIFGDDQQDVRSRGDSG